MNRRQVYGRYYSQWPHLSSLYNSNRELEEDGAYAEHMVGFDNVFESPDEPSGAYKFYMAPREEFVLQSEPQVYSSSGGSLYDKSDDMGVSESLSSSEYRGSTCKVLVFAFLTFGLIAVIAAAVTLSVILSQDIRHSPSITESNVTVTEAVPLIESSLKMTNRTFTPELEDQNSTEFKQMESEFCEAIEEMYTRDDSPLKDLFESCEVVEFSPGSVIVKYRIKLKPSALKQISSLPASMMTFFMSMLEQIGGWNKLMVQASSVQEFNLVENPSETSIVSRSIQTSQKDLKLTSYFSPRIFTESSITPEILATQESVESVHMTEIYPSITGSQMFFESSISIKSSIQSSEKESPSSSLYTESLFSKSQTYDSSIIYSKETKFLSTESHSSEFEPPVTMDTLSTEQYSIEPSRVAASDISDVSNDQESAKLSELFSVTTVTDDVDTILIESSEIQSSVPSKDFFDESYTSVSSFAIHISLDVIDSLKTLSMQSASKHEESEPFLSSSTLGYELSARTSQTFSDVSKHSIISGIVKESFLSFESLQPSLAMSSSVSHFPDASDKWHSVYSSLQLSNDERLSISTSASSVDEPSQSIFTKDYTSSTFVGTSHDSITLHGFSTTLSSTHSPSFQSDTALVFSSQSVSFLETNMSTATTVRTSTHQATPIAILTSLYTDETTMKSAKSLYNYTDLLTEYDTLSRRVSDSPLSSQKTTISYASIPFSWNPQLSETTAYSPPSSYFAPSVSVSSLQKSLIGDEKSTTDFNLQITPSLSFSYIEHSTLSSASIISPSSYISPTSLRHDVSTLSSPIYFAESVISGTVVLDEISPTMSSADKFSSSSLMSYPQHSNIESSEPKSDSYPDSGSESIRISDISSNISDLKVSFETKLEKTLSSFSPFTEVQSDILSSSIISSSMDSFAVIQSTTEGLSRQTFSSEGPTSSASTIVPTFSSSDEEYMTLSNYSSFLVIDSSADGQISTNTISDFTIDAATIVSNHTAIDSPIGKISVDSSLVETASTDDSAVSIASQSLLSRFTATTGPDIEFSKSELWDSSTISMSIQSVFSQFAKSTDSLAALSKSKIESFSASYDSESAISVPSYPDSYSISVPFRQTSANITQSTLLVESASSRFQLMTSDLMGLSQTENSLDYSTEHATVSSSFPESHIDTFPQSSFSMYMQSDLMSTRILETDVSLSSMATNYISGNSSTLSFLVSESSAYGRSETVTKYSTGETDQTLTSVISNTFIMNTSDIGSVTSHPSSTDSKSVGIPFRQTFSSSAHSTILTESAPSVSRFLPSDITDLSYTDIPLNYSTQHITVSSSFPESNVGTIPQSSFSIHKHPMSFDLNSASASFRQISTSLTQRSQDMTSAFTDFGNSNILFTESTGQVTVSSSFPESNVDTILQSSISTYKHPEQTRTTVLETSVPLESMSTNMSGTSSTLTFLVSESSVYKGDKTSPKFTIEGENNITSFISDSTSALGSFGTGSVTSSPLPFDTKSVSVPSRQASVSTNQSTFLTESANSTYKLMTSTLTSPGHSDILLTYSTEIAAISSSFIETEFDTILQSSFSIDQHADLINITISETNVSHIPMATNYLSGSSEVSSFLVSESSVYESDKPMTKYLTVKGDQNFTSLVSDTIMKSVQNESTFISFVATASDHAEFVNSTSVSKIYNSLDLNSKTTGLPYIMSTYDDFTYSSSVQLKSHPFVLSETLQPSEQSFKMLQTSTKWTAEVSLNLEQITYSTTKPSSTLVIATHSQDTLSGNMQSFVSSPDMSGQITLNISDSYVSQSDEVMTQSPHRYSSNVGETYQSDLIKSTESSYFDELYSSTELFSLNSMSNITLPGTLPKSTSLSYMINLTDESSSELVATATSSHTYQNKPIEKPASSTENYLTTLSNELFKTFTLQTDNREASVLTNKYEETAYISDLTNSVLSGSLSNPLSSSLYGSLIDEISKISSYSNIPVKSEMTSFLEMETSTESIPSLSKQFITSSTIDVTEHKSYISHVNSKQIDSTLNFYGDQSPSIPSSSKLIGIVTSVSDHLLPDNISASPSLPYSSVTDSYMSRMDFNVSSVMDIINSSTSSSSEYFSMKENMSTFGALNSVMMSDQNTSDSMDTFSSSLSESSLSVSSILPSLEINVTSGVVVSSVRYPIDIEDELLSTMTSSNFYTLSTSSFHNTASYHEEMIHQVNNSIYNTYLNEDNNRTKFDSSMYLNESIISPTAASSLFDISNGGNMTVPVSDKTTLPNYNYSFSTTEQWHNAESKMVSQTDSILYNVSESEEGKTMYSSERNILSSVVSNNDKFVDASSLTEFSLNGKSYSISSDSVSSVTASSKTLNETEYTSRNELLNSESGINSSISKSDIMPSHSLTLNDTAMTDSSPFNNSAPLLWTIEISQHSTTSLNALDGSEYSEGSLLPSMLSTDQLKSTSPINVSVIPLMNITNSVTNMTFVANDSTSNQTMYQNVTDVSYSQSLSLIEIDIFDSSSASNISYSKTYNDTNIFDITNTSKTLSESDTITILDKSYFYSSVIESSQFDMYEVSSISLVSNNSQSASLSTRLKE